MTIINNTVLEKVDFNNKLKLIVSEDILISIISMDLKQIELVSEKDKDLELFFVYEFSDRLKYFSQSNLSCASILNLVDTGHLTLQQAVEAMLA